jgi:abortive infection bacteriophage resistance protein
MNHNNIFNKPAIPIADQISLLKQKNLIIDNIDEAEHHLTVIGYYRLMIYFKPFMASKNVSSTQFEKGTLFSDVLNFYIFDRELRLLVIDALERIEVAFRTSISNTMSLKYGAHWYLDPKLFVQPTQHEFFLEEIKSHLKRSHEDFIKSYYLQYQHPEHPPSWMVMECISFGTISKIYSNIKDRSVRKTIGDTLGQYSEVIKSWMRSLTYTRNLCAHHSRLWNRFFVNKPQVNLDVTFERNQSPFYLQAHIIQTLLTQISPGNHWNDKLYRHFLAHPHVAYIDMGFETDWEKDVFWLVK